MLAYKLLSVRKNGTIGSLFINRQEVLKTGVWMDSKPYPTKGFAFRPFWHATALPVAPHLGHRNRKWYEVEIEDDATVFDRPVSQGGTWYLAKRMKINRALPEEERSAVISMARTASAGATAQADPAQLRA